MSSKLIPILADKAKEVAVLYDTLANYPQGQLAKIFSDDLTGISNRLDFSQALKRGTFVKVIAELKRRSPSKGALNTNLDAAKVVDSYIKGGAAAISVLTDQRGFGGSLADLQAMANKFSMTGVPFLRKDFLIDPIQIAESILYGADAILLIAAVLKENLPAMLKKARALKIDALVEVHSIAEAEQAVAAGATLIGVNNRDLTSFEVDTQRAFTILKYLSDAVIKIAESGIVEVSLAKEYYAAGYAAVLVGETLVKSTNPQQWIQACSQSTE